MKKTLVLFRFGHIYSFWSAGQYYVLELLKIYDVCLIVSNNYKGDTRFQRFLNENNIEDTLYEPIIKRNNIKDSKKYFALINNYLDEKKPNIVIQNDYIEVQNMYIFCISRQLNNNRIHVVLSMSAPSSEKTSFLLYESRLARIKNVLHNLFFSKLVLYIINKGKHIESLLHNYIIPLIIGIKRPYLTSSAYHNIDNVPKYLTFDYFFTNNNNEVEYINNLLSNLDPNIIEVISPQYNLCRHEILPDKHTSMLFVPSLLLMNGIINDYEKELWKKWIKSLKMIVDKESIINIGIKFHPSNKENWVEELATMKEYFQQRLPKCIIYDERISADSLVKKYTVIVSDCSTVLLQSRYLRDRKIISLDFNNISGSGEMENYSGINYFRENENISNLINREIKICTYRPNKKSFLEYILKNET